MHVGVVDVGIIIRLGQRSYVELLRGRRESLGTRLPGSIHACWCCECWYVYSVPVGDMHVGQLCMKIEVMGPENYSLCTSIFNSNPTPYIL